MATTGLATSMAVNTLATGLIVFRILKVFLEVKPTLVERTLGSTGGTKLRHIIFVVIESGMALFVIQLVGLVLSITPVTEEQWPVVQAANNFIIVIDQMLIVIIIGSVHFVLLITIAWLGYRTNDNFGTGFNEIVLR